ncbi:sucrose phosphorylase [Butyrivibrio sp. XB500-5]|uniref:sucrose phosphorylase n=1 Tax=Butyrivibrio sp. XB500-5 TaxID=2364880 RepID=UPI000EAA5E97|nr:sucrose phosphorylase [Butyrivibrio sp. XB500-5]RKM59098.1 sucrose phosphorylase [Butyrivibrio sp. XB500-5]
MSNVISANNKPMLNAYPDSLGGTLKDIVDFLSKDELTSTFSSFYILPSLYHTDLDRGFSVIDYGLEKNLATKEDLDALRKMGIDLKLDFILNHASVQSPQFQDLLNKGDDSEYKDFFINWNKFWEGKGELTQEGYIQPDEEYIKDMFFRKPGLPILMVTMPDGKKVPYWNTFYQEVKNTPQGIKYLGQMDLNIKSDLVWEFYDDTLHKISDYGASIVRLDAFAYAPKEPGEKNFLNEPGTWDLLSKVRELADKYKLTLLPEIHASYSEKIYETIADKGYMTYDFFLPGLIIDAFENKYGDTIVKWANELIDKKIRTVNMLGCHDGIPLLDLKGLISEEQIQSLIDTVVARGGYVKDLHGAKNMYYQVNATYYSALGEDDKKMLAARALQLFMPGKPQVWYLDLLAGKNDHEAVKAAGAGGHKEINRTNYSKEMIENALEKDVVKRQLELLKFRNSYRAFSFDSDITASCEGKIINIKWKNGEYEALLKLDLESFDFVVVAKTGEDEITV